MLRFVTATKEKQLHSTRKEHTNPLHNIILLRVIGKFFRGNFQHGRNCLIVVLQFVTDGTGHMLVNQNNSNIATCNKGLEGFFYCLDGGVSFDDEEVGVFGCAVTNSGEKEASYGVLYWLKKKDNGKAIKRVKTCKANDSTKKADSSAEFHHM